MVDDESYKNSKKLYILLKMRNLSDLNNLYNAQDVIIMNSGSKLSSCIQREQTKSILVLPVNNTQIEVFEKTLCSSFSCVNMRLSFDIEIFMPNLTKIWHKN